jgi:ubiquinone/menaquinone biosynthesis C-methylase UbiE
VLEEARRVLKPQGKIFILDVTSDVLFIRWLDGLFRLEKGHVKLYSTNGYRKLFEQACLSYSATKSTMLPMMKIHIGEKG